VKKMRMLKTGRVMGYLRGLRENIMVKVSIGAAMSAFFLLVLLTGAGCSRQSFETRGSLDGFTGYLDGRVPLLMDRYGVPGVSMALIRGGEPVWSGAYGYASLESGTRMTVDSVCRAESISKSVTAWGVMRLVEQGLVNLDGPVQHYLGGWQLPESEYNEQEVTVRRLLSGNAGMPLGLIGEGTEYPPRSDMPSVRDFLTDEARLIREPGSGFMYSNVGFNLLELLIEEAAGRDFAEYMAAEVLIPLGMSDSSFSWEESFHSMVPTGYELQGTPVPPYVYPVKASGGLFSDVEDIARFASAGMTGSSNTKRSVLSRESIRMIHAPEVDIPGIFGLVADSYGFGHFIEILSDGRQAVWHGGQGHGWMTHFHAISESGDGIVILTNSQRSWPFIAQVLTDWSRWIGIEPVKFGRIIYAVTAARMLIWVFLLVSLWLVYRFVRGLAGGDRRWAPLSRVSRGVRLLQASLAVGVIAFLAWSAAQPYLFVRSIVPGTAERAGISLMVLAFIVILSTLFPPVGDRTKRG
jgi:CubicO group peptidase (beta-lactamase class C family)